MIDTNHIYFVKCCVHHSLFKLPIQYTRVCILLLLAASAKTHCVHINISYNSTLPNPQEFPKRKRWVTKKHLKQTKLIGSQWSTFKSVIACMPFRNNFWSLLVLYLVCAPCICVWRRRSAAPSHMARARNTQPVFRSAPPGFGRRVAFTFHTRQPYGRNCSRLKVQGCGFRDAKTAFAFRISYWMSACDIFFVCGKLFDIFKNFPLTFLMYTHSAAFVWRRGLVG